MGNKIFTFSDARKYARRRMPRMTFDFIDGSAGDERACALNVESIEAIEKLANAPGLDGDAYSCSDIS